MQRDVTTEGLAPSVPGRGTPPPYAAPPPPRLTVDRVVRALLAVALVATVVLLLWYFSRLVVFLVIGMALSYLMRPIMHRLEGLGLGRIPAILMTFVLVFGGAGILLTYLVPFLVAQINDIAQEISPERIRGVATAVEERIRQVFPLKEGRLQEGVTNVLETLFREDRLTNVVGSVVDIFTNIFYAVIVIPFITFFFLKDGAKIRRSLLRLAPNRYFEVTLAIIEKIETNIGRYLRALLLQSISIATVATVLLYVVGLKYALAVGIFAGLANTIPYFGPFIGFLAGTLVGIAQTGDFSLVPGVILAMALTQVADNVFFQPFIFSRAARTHPLVILFVVLIGAQLAGIVGMLVAIPLTTTVRVTVEQVLWSLRNYRILRTA
ncbi:AI-2E family transporter [Rhodocaloribacter sp.]